jgi:ABC-type bacteriocin/lantibiotic exporter with double-glycine peptidase domain
MNTYEDILKNNENILLYNSKEFEKNIYINQENLFKQAQSKELRNINNFKITFMILLSIFICCIIIYSSYLVIKDKMTITVLIILTTASILMLKSFTSLIRRCAESIVDFGPTLKDNNFFKSIQQNYIHFGAKNNFFNKFDIQIKNIEYNINDKTILKNLSLDVSFKDSILIKGNIGVGKSTLLRILIGYIKPTKGDIYFDNIHLNDIDMIYFRKYITIMHQSVILFNRSVLENIFYNIEKDSLEWNRKYQELKKMKLFSYMKNFINEKDATKLSGGQKQIILLLRCYFKNIKILLLDEPTANIDFETKKIVYDLIQQFINNITVICVSHDPSIEYLFKKIYFLKNGKLFLQ